LADPAAVTVRSIAAGQPWANAAWVACRGRAEVARLLAQTHDGRFELHLGRPADREAGLLLLSALTEARPGRVETVVPAEMPDVPELLGEAGLVLERDVWQMWRELASAPDEPRWPGGIAVRSYDDAGDAANVHALLERAFAANAESVLPFEPWHAWMTGDPEFAADSWFLAEQDGRLAGVALCWSGGWLKDLAVDPDQRGRGLGEALCLHVFGEFHRRGVARVGLKVDADNPTGAVRLYERVGMQRDRVYHVFGRG
jgi:ribosomal protein S18 acetylase RimI-like enzyme